MKKFSQEQFMKRIEELFAKNNYIAKVSDDNRPCSDDDTCWNCPISSKHTNIKCRTTIEKYFPILERKLKLKKLLET